MAVLIKSVMVGKTVLVTDWHLVGCRGVNGWVGVAVDHVEPAI